ncbi:MAG TPA: hypothetical protein DCL77_00740 [Prolixibacteraceae bacterium]|jgi:hypothetical protein|nr:hypothetical protein [Prolixibacteraceae bacterium]
MEIEELKTIWQQYDRKLNNLEKLNKKLVMETLLKNPQSKLNRLKFRSIYGILVGPIVLPLALHPLFKIENIDLKFIVGCILSLAVLIYLGYSNLKAFNALKQINLGADPVIESAHKVNEYSSIMNGSKKYYLINCLALFAGVLLIGWKAFNFDTKFILYMAALLAFTFVWGIKQFRLQQQKIAVLEKEILDLKEYEK